MGERLAMSEPPPIEELLGKNQQGAAVEFAPNAVGSIESTNCAALAELYSHTQ